MDFFQLVERRARERREAIPDFPVLVAGITRGGTSYLARALRNLGVYAGHESIFGDRKIYSPPRCGRLEVEVSGAVAPWIEGLVDRGVRIIHLVREPAACIQSNARFHSVSWLVAAVFYFRWNRRIEAVAERTIRLEDLPVGMEHIFEALGRPLPAPERVAEAFATADRQATGAGLGASWDRLPREIREFGERHGYGPCQTRPRRDEDS